MKKAIVTGLAGLLLLSSNALARDREEDYFEDLSGHSYKTWVQCEVIRENSVPTNYSYYSMLTTCEDGWSRLIYSDCSHTSVKLDTVYDIGDKIRLPSGDKYGCIDVEVIGPAEVYGAEESLRKR